MCPPGLHITLGIFQRLFNLLEEECHQLDLSVNENSASSGSSFIEYQQARSAVKVLEEAQAALRVELNQAQQILALLLLSSPEPHLDGRIQDITRYMHDHTKKITTNVRLAIHYIHYDITIRIILLLKETELYQRGLNVRMEFLSNLLRWPSNPLMLKDRHTMGALLLVTMYIRLCRY